MTTAGLALVEIIRDEIRATGPISFARFMERALYHPELGYYASGRAILGRGGDYFTNVSVGPVFARLIAMQLKEIWQKLDCPNDFTIVEQGAHDGRFARDLLEALARDHAPDFAGAVSYRIVEPFPRLAARQQEKLSSFAGRIDWADSLDRLDSFVGVHFSNELFDALSVHLIISKGVSDDAEKTEWKERCVGLEDGGFILVERELPTDSLGERVGKLPKRNPGYETEINLLAPELVRELSLKLQRGCVLAIDYGFSRSLSYDEARATGTLQCRAQHRLLPGPFEMVGQSDITAHVEWTALAEAAEASGLTVSGFADQHHFFTGLLAASPGLMESFSPKDRRGLQTLLHPEMLGRSFQVLALAKDLRDPTTLSGFKFSRPPRAALDLEGED